jgi:protein-disulfide isomerase
VGNGEDYRRGDDNSKVIVQVFSDYGCPHCKTATDAIVKAQDIVGLDKVLFVYRFFPLSNQCNPYMSFSGGYPYSCSLAEATRCAGQQNKFWEFKSWAFSGQYWDNQERAKSFSLAGMQSYVASLGMDVNAFTFCVENHVELQKLKDDAVIANKLNIQGTPLILINGTPYEGAHTGEAFVQAFIQRLQKVN